MDNVGKLHLKTKDNKTLKPGEENQIYLTEFSEREWEEAKKHYY